MSDDREPTGHHTTVWVVLPEDGTARRLAAFWTEADATTYASLLRDDGLSVEAIVRQVVVGGERPRCRLCGEPVVLDDSADPMSWIHAPDANDLADHTAEV